MYSIFESLKLIPCNISYIRAGLVSTHSIGVVTADVANEMNFGMHHASGVGSITQPAV